MEKESPPQPTIGRTYSLSSYADPAIEVLLTCLDPKAMRDTDETLPQARHYDAVHWAQGETTYERIHHRNPSPLAGSAGCDRATIAEEEPAYSRHSGE